MAWEGSNRRAELPRDWHRTRRRIFRRDGHRCTHVDSDGQRCMEAPTDVDHIGDKLDHDDSNLRSLCDWHHKTRTGRQGGQASARARREIESRWRLTEAHPGAL